MRVVLRADLDGVGKRGDIVDVTDGYARNYLIPKGQAFKATRDRESAEVVARRLVPIVITIPARAGAEGKLFGSVTAADVIQAVATQAGVELDRRRVSLDEPIKTLGTHEVPVKLHTDVQFRVTVEVTSDR